MVICTRMITRTVTMQNDYQSSMWLINLQVLQTSQPWKIFWSETGLLIIKHTCLFYKWLLLYSLGFLTGGVATPSPPSLSQSEPESEYKSARERNN